MSEPDPMPHVIEPATSGRARCRGCGRLIAKGELRFGERLPNPYGEGAMTLWLHLSCAAYRRPQPFLETLQRFPGLAADSPALLDTARFSLAHRRVQRLAGLERAPSGRARCRFCRKAIAKDSWRIPLVFYQEGVFDASGFVHIVCAPAYFETSRLLGALRHFAADLSDAEFEDASGCISGAD